jgi:hypothetical protein
MKTLMKNEMLKKEQARSTTNGAYMCLRRLTLRCSWHMSVRNATSLQSRIRRGLYSFTIPSKTAPTST